MRAIALQLCTLALLAPAGVVGQGKQAQGRPEVFMASGRVPAGPSIVTGTVRQKDGTPVAGARVLIPGMKINVPTGPDGRYSITLPPGIQPGVPADIIAQRGGLWPVLRVFVTRPAMTLTVDFEMSLPGAHLSFAQGAPGAGPDPGNGKVGKIVGEVVLLDGTPVPNLRAGIDELEKTATSGPNGIFIFDSVPAGAYRVRLFVRAAPGAPMPIMPVIMQEGDSGHLIFKLKREAPAPRRDTTAAARLPGLLPIPRN